MNTKKTTGKIIIILLGTSDKEKFLKHPEEKDTLYKRNKAIVITHFMLKRNMKARKHR